MEGGEGRVDKRGSKASLEEGEGGVDERGGKASFKGLSSGDRTLLEEGKGKVGKGIEGDEG